MMDPVFSTDGKTTRITSQLADELEWEPGKHDVVIDSLHNLSPEELRQTPGFTDLDPYEAELLLEYLRSEAEHGWYRTAADHVPLTEVARALARREEMKALMEADAAAYSA